MPQQCLSHIPAASIFKWPLLLGLRAPPLLYTNLVKFALPPPRIPLGFHATKGDYGCATFPNGLFAHYSKDLLCAARVRFPLSSSGHTLCEGCATGHFFVDTEKHIFTLRLSLSLSPLGGEQHVRQRGTSLLAQKPVTLFRTLHPQARGRKTSQGTRRNTVEYTDLYKK